MLLPDDLIAALTRSDVVHASLHPPAVSRDVLARFGANAGSFFGFGNKTTAPQ